MEAEINKLTLCPRLPYHKAHFNQNCHSTSFIYIEKCTIGAKFRAMACKCCSSFGELRGLKQTCALLSPERFCLENHEQCMQSSHVFALQGFVAFLCFLPVMRLISSYFLLGFYCLYYRDSCVWFCSIVMKFHCYGRPSVLFRQSFALGREFITFRFADGSQAAWNEWQVDASGDRAIVHHSSIVASNAASRYISRW